MLEPVQTFLNWLREQDPPPSEEELAARIGDLDGEMGKDEAAELRIALEQLAGDAAARADIFRFAETVIRDEDGKPIQTRPVDRAIQNHIEQCRADGFYAGILAPIGIGKSVQAVIVRALWDIREDTNTLVKIVSSTDDEAIKRLVTVGRVIANSADFKRILGDVVRPSIKGVQGDRSEGEWSKHRINVERTSGSAEPTVEAYGVQAAAQGSRAKVLLFDDCVDARSALESPALKKQIEDKFRNQWMTRVVQHDHSAVWVATIWTEDDLSRQLMKNPNWRFLVIRVSDDFENLTCELIERDVKLELDDADIPADGWRISKELYGLPLPPTWTRESLQKMFISLGEIAFNRALKQKPYSHSDRAFPHFENCVSPSVRFEDEARRAVGEGWKIFTGVDPSSKKRKGNAIVTIGIDNAGVTHAIDSRIGAWSSPDLAEELNKVDHQFKPLVFAVEDNSMQAALIEWVQTYKEGFTWWDRIFPFQTTGKNKHNESMGIRTLDIEFANRAWIVPSAHWNIGEHESENTAHSSGCGQCLLIHSLRWYPLDKRYTDLVMAAWFARTIARSLGIESASAEADMLNSVPEDSFFSQNMDSIGQTYNPDDDGDRTHEFRTDELTTDF